MIDMQKLKGVLVFFGFYGTSKKPNLYHKLAKGLFGLLSIVHNYYSYQLETKINVLSNCKNKTELYPDPCYEPD